VAASTFAWGRNVELAHATNALLLETNLTLNDRDTWFGRLEVVQKTAHDLEVVATQETHGFAVSKDSGGWLYALHPARKKGNKKNKKKGGYI
jgi:hypothetical protein